MEPLYEMPDGLSLYHGDVRAVLAALPAESVDCVVTSPPYLGLRMYQGVEPTVWGGDPECAHDWGQLERGKRKDILPADVTTLDCRTGIDDRQEGAATNGGRFCRKCAAWLGTFGNEPDISLYVAHSVEICSAIWRVLKPSGVMWWNIGDSYTGDRGDGRNGGPKQVTNVGSLLGSKFTMPGLKRKDLMLVPYRFAIAAQADGWWVRSAITWAKKACMPESVTDRPTCATEMIWLLAKGERYYFDQTAVQEKAEQPNGMPALTGQHKAGDLQSLRRSHLGTNQGASTRNIRNFWLLSPEPLRDAHYAAFPTEIPRRAILAGCPAGGVVLDPFVGSGTTLVVARQLGRRGIGIDLSESYLRDIAIPRLEGQPMALPLEVP